MLIRQFFMNMQCEYSPFYSAPPFNFFAPGADAKKHGGAAVLEDSVRVNVVFNLGQIYHFLFYLKSVVDC